MNRQLRQTGPNIPFRGIWKKNLYALHSRGRKIRVRLEYVFEYILLVRTARHPDQLILHHFRSDDGNAVGRIHLEVTERIQRSIENHPQGIRQGNTPQIQDNPPVGIRGARIRRPRSRAVSVHYVAGILRIRSRRRPARPLRPLVRPRKLSGIERRIDTLPHLRQPHPAVVPDPEHALWKTPLLPVLPAVHLHHALCVPRARSHQDQTE